MEKIYVVALLAQRDDRLLVVRKRGTIRWFQPGGKPLPGEEPEAALHRELLEELGCTLTEVRFLERVVCAAANEPGAELTADVFAATVTGALVPQNEIEAVQWVRWDDLDPVQFAPLIVEHMGKWRA